MAAKRPEIVVNEGRLGGIRTRLLSEYGGTGLSSRGLGL
jgi:hypothetical protein